MSITTNNRRPDLWGSIPIPARVAERAATKFLKVGECYISTYSVASHGYAQIGWRDEVKIRMTLAHRASWVHHHGQIPVGMTVDHIQSMCSSRRCVRDAHLRLLENLENARRTSGRDWPLGECVAGHPNSELVFRGSKWRCRLCVRRWDRDYRARKRAAA